MSRTVISHGGDLYHLVCLAPELRGDGRTVPAAEIEEDQVCEECMAPLVGEEAPDDDQDVDDDTPPVTEAP